MKIFMKANQKLKRRNTFFGNVTEVFELLIIVKYYNYYL